MLLKNKILRNFIVGGLVFLFGFSQFLEIFRNKTVTIGPFKVKISDIGAFGGFRPGSTQQNYQRAAYQVFQLEAFSREAQRIGLVITKEDITKYIQDSFKNEDNEFDPDSMDAFIQKEGMSKEGLIKFAKLELLKRQLSGVVKLGLRAPDQFVQKFVTGVNRNKAGYYAVLDTQVDIKKYGAPVLDDLFELLCNSPELIQNQTCEVIFIGQDTEDYPIEELRNKFKTITYPIQEGQICASCKMNIGNLEIDPKTYLSKKYLNNSGEYVRVQFKMLFGMNQADVEKAWYECDAAKAKACQTIIESIKNQLRGNPNLIKSKNVLGVRFNYLEGVTFKECFQVQCRDCVGGEKCDSCMTNGCICKDCFNPRNKFNLTRAQAILILFGKKNELYSYSGNDGHHLVFPAEEIEGEVTTEEVAKVSDEIRLQISEGAARILLEEILQKQLIVI